MEDSYRTSVPASLPTTPESTTTLSSLQKNTINIIRSPLRRWNLSRESFRNAGRISGDDCRLPSTRRCRWEERKYLKKCCIFAKNTRGQFNKTPAMAPQVPAFEVKLATDSAFKLTWMTVLVTEPWQEEVTLPGTFRVRKTLAEDTEDNR
ncbi:uncharacterized protein LOC135101670 isoform X3 [Scylla paramamosain]|uniref:uncharacterized protein LOC135101670 isoform X3 n=1 Tax=Scylla paramamosain TaxID=85552 RepID=UPI003083B74B